MWMILFQGNYNERDISMANKAKKLLQKSSI